MVTVREAYDEFQNRNDKTKILNGKLYYRIIWSGYINIKEIKKDYLSVVPSPDMPKNPDAVYQDENGNHFVLGGLTHIRFIGEIPEWYLKCGECNMKWQETKEIGNYLTILK